MQWIIWTCLPDGADRNLTIDGCIRVLSGMDTSAEPTAIAADSLIAAVNTQHVDDASIEKADDGYIGDVLMKIGFKAQM